MYLAEIETEHFTFRGFGETENDAIWACAEAFNKTAPQRLEIDDLRECYGINTLKFRKDIATGFCDWTRRV